ncbi:MAG: ABC transporter substrate-binding protein [Desulfatitalea sp.]|nr:ABC transporter substrate-binding protein [Desulfatitalea sp.]NNK00627.1 ABC transporter substrate-binding protein [Desulfatitalea sp.]
MHIVLTNILCFMACVFCLACGQDKAPFKIVANISLTGPGSSSAGIGEAMQLAVDEVNAMGGVSGRKIELIVEDNQSSPEVAVTLFRRVEAAHRPDIYISGLSSITKTLSPLAEANQVPLIGLITSAPEVTQNKKWTFRFYFTAYDEAETAMNILEKLQIDRLGVIYLDDPYGRSCHLLLSEKVKAAGGAVTATPFVRGQTDFSGQIVQVMDTQAVYLAGYVSHMTMLVPQLRTAGYAGEIICGSGGASSKVRRIAAAEGIYVAAPAIYNPQYIYARSLREKFYMRYGRELEHQDATGYDLIKLLAGLLDGKPIDRASIKKTLEQGFTYPSAMGNVTVPAGSHEINFELLPGRIKNAGIDYRF